MTKEIAIQRLDRLMDVVKPEITEAIEWLEGQTEQLDTISRQDAIDLLLANGMITASIYVERMPSAEPEITLESALDYLHSIGWMQEHDRIMSASAQPDRKTGEWIPKDDGRYHCSSCDGIAPKGYRWDYCPNCGAKMGVEHDTSD